MLGVRKVHDVDTFDVVEELVRLLFAFTCGFADDQAAKYVKGQCSLTANP